MNLRKIYRIFVQLAFAALFGVGLFSRCASPLAPTGGPSDTLPPRIVQLNPAYGTTNFNQKRIFIEFDEYIKLNDQQNQFFVSPFMTQKPTLTIRGRGIQIDISDTLKENQTYALNFGNSIIDNNEGNVLYNYRYVFSTGEQIDSMIISGYTVDSYSQDSVSGTFIYFYDVTEIDTIGELDSTVLKFRPTVVGRSQDNGIFIAENLKPIDYRIYAVKDNNNNQQYDLGVDRVAYIDSVFNPKDMPSFNVWYDTTRHYLVAKPQLYFRLFEDESFIRQVLTGVTRPDRHQIVLDFSAKDPVIDGINIEGVDSSVLIYDYLKPTRDSIGLWIDMPSDSIPDTLRGTITYLKHDTANVLRVDTTKLNLVWRTIDTRSRRERREDEKRAEEESSGGQRPEGGPPAGGQRPEGGPDEEGEQGERAEDQKRGGRDGEDSTKVENPFKYQIETREINPEKHISIGFDYPLIDIDTSKISLIREADNDKRYRVKYELEQDTSNIKSWLLKARWMPKEKYSLSIPEGVLTNVARQSNDSINASFAVLDPEKYASIVLNINGESPEDLYIIQLLDVSGKVLDQKTNVQDQGKYTFSYIYPGNVRLRIIQDKNGNEKWDGGALIARRQSERVEIFISDQGEEDLVAKANWEMEFDLNMADIFYELTMDNVNDHIELRRKAEEKRILQNKLKNTPQYHPVEGEDEGEGADEEGSTEEDEQEDEHDHDHSHEDGLTDDHSHEDIEDEL